MAQKRKRLSQMFNKKESDDYRRLSLASPDESSRCYRDSLLENEPKKVKQACSERLSTWERRKQYDYEIKKLHLDKSASPCLKNKSKVPILRNVNSKRRTKNTSNLLKSSFHEDFEKQNENTNNKENISETTKTIRSLTFTVRKPLFPVLQNSEDDDKDNCSLLTDKLSEQNSDTFEEYKKCKKSNKVIRNHSYVVSKCDNSKSLPNISLYERSFEEWINSKNLTLLQYRNINYFDNYLSKMENKYINDKEFMKQKKNGITCEKSQTLPNINWQKLLIELKALLEKDLPVQFATCFLDGIKIYMPSCIDNSLYWECKGILAIKEENERDALEFYDKAINIEEKSDAVFEV
ncbi:uncharacterized protein [Centruroides vittatus]|uniref:uncharacterized protein n=1 Tax=Centruroides vittatus TaxID=120091 RepID=UPI0035105836